MERFAHFARRRRVEPVPSSTRFTHDLSALEEALGGAGDPRAVVLEVGTRAAAQGSAWTELLLEVEDVCRRVTGGPPTYDLVRELSIAWAEASLQYAHGLTCEDPLTGLATLLHLRTRLEGTYRLATRRAVLANDTAALVVVELSRLAPQTYGLLGSLAMLEVAAALRAVFDGDETVARAGERRAVVLVARDDHLPVLLRSLRLQLDTCDQPAVAHARIWVEGLPPTTRGADQLMDELAR